MEGEEEGNVWEVEKILDYEKRPEGEEYLLQWKGYPEHDATWVRAERLKCDELLKEFWKDRNKKNWGVTKISLPHQRRLKAWGRKFGAQAIRVVPIAEITNPETALGEGILNWHPNFDEHLHDQPLFADTTTEVIDPAWEAAETKPFVGQRRPPAGADTEPLRSYYKTVTSPRSPKENETTTTEPVKKSIEEKPLADSSSEGVAEEAQEEEDLDDETVLKMVDFEGCEILSHCIMHHNFVYFDILFMEGYKLRVDRSVTLERNPQAVQKYEQFLLDS